MAEIEPQKATIEDDHDADAVLASLEEEDDTSYREQRLQEMKTEAASTRSKATMGQEVAYITLKNDDEALRFTTEYERAVLHFFHPDFARCSTMDQHLQHIASKHTEYGNADVAFGRVDVKQAPFVVEKLGIRILPCVIGFANGIAKGRVTGFEGICWDSKEDSKMVTLALEENLVEWTVLKKKLLDDLDDMEDDGERPAKAETGRRSIRGRDQQKTEDDDDDWD